MNASTEPEAIFHTLAIDVEYVGIAPLLLVLIASEIADLHDRALRYRDPGYFHVLRCNPVLMRDRRMGPQHLLDNVPDQAAIFQDPRQQIGILQDQIESRCEAGGWWFRCQLPATTARS